MSKLYVVTGAKGHLGSTIIRLLCRQGCQVRGLILPTETAEDAEGLRYYRGDVREVDSLRPLFAHTEDQELYVIHTAGIVDIGGEPSPLLYDVNVGGTRNILALCREYGAARLVHVSSVHAIPELDHIHVLSEVDAFSPDLVTGAYAKTKAEATQAVLAAAKDGLDAVVVHPSGILGPFDQSGNHLVQLITDYLRGWLPACVRGGYDLVDVRDVARGCLLAAEKGRRGQCYILSNRHYEIRDVLQMVRRLTGVRPVPTLPMWMAQAAAPMLQWYAKCRKKRPLYTAYSLYTLRSNDQFSHDKATSELGYRPRELFETIRDTVAWYQKKNRSAIPI